MCELRAARGRRVLEVTGLPLECSLIAVANVAALAAYVLIYRIFQQHTQVFLATIVHARACEVVMQAAYGK